MKQILRIGLIGASFAPLVVLAANNLEGALNTFGDLVRTATPIVVALALLGFFWGLAMYIFSGAGNKEKRKEGLQIMLWGILALFVMISVFGIVNTLQATLGVGGGSVTVPCIDTGSSPTHVPCHNGVQQ